MFYIFKRVFMEDDIVDIKIILNHIEDVNVESIHIEGVFFSYNMQPRPSTAELRGLMLIETVLYDCEKFLQDHTLSLKK